MTNLRIVDDRVEHRARVERARARIVAAIRDHARPYESTLGDFAEAMQAEADLWHRLATNADDFGRNR